MALDVQGELNRLAGTSGLGESRAANVYAGTTGLETVGALNTKASSVGLLRASSLVDDFATFDAAKWPNSYGTFGVTAGRGRIACDTGYSAFLTGQTYTFSNSTFLVRVFPAAISGGTHVYTQVLVMSSTVGTDLCVEVDTGAGTILFANRVGYFDAAGVTLTYDGTAHAWVKMQESRGTTTWSTSPDGLVWTVRKTIASPAWVTDTNIQMQLVAHRDAGVDNVAEFDNVNAPQGQTSYASGLPLEMQGVCNFLAGTSGLGTAGALAAIS